MPSRRGDWGAYYRDLVRTVRTGGPLPVEPQDAVDVLHVLEAAVRSSQRREVVDLA